MKSPITQQFNNNILEVSFTHNGVKYLFLGTEIGDNGHVVHEVQNSVTGGIKTVVHSKLESIVDFNKVNRSI